MSHWLYFICHFSIFNDILWVRAFVEKNTIIFNLISPYILDFTKKIICKEIPDSFQHFSKRCQEIKHLKKNYYG